MNTPASKTPEVSTRKLVTATVIAIISSAVLMVAVVLPSEFGKDPFGTGRLLGLTSLGESKHAASEPVQVATTSSTTESKTAEAIESTASTTVADSAGREDTLSIELKPGRGAEIKATMQVGQQMKFAWKTNGAVVYFDFHGDEFNAPKDVFTSYLEGEKNQHNGEFTAKFAGVHGWYWKNRSQEPIKIELKTSGNYEQIREL